MKWVSNSIASKKDCVALLYEVINLIAGDSFIIEDKKVIFPNVEDLICKIKYSEEPGETKFSIKINWANDIPVTEETEDDSVEPGVEASKDG
ncbi:MAG: hypothetical protein M1609_07485 [Firmicutes bacterium]|nr:hypothetical protein [Bacillota bacterium]